MLGGGVAGGVGFLMGPWANAAFGGGLRGSLIAGALEGSLTDGAMQITINWASGRTWHHNLGWTLLGGAAAGGVGGGMGWVTPRMTPASLRQMRVASHACSFAADTPVATEDGEVPISAVDRGDQALAYHETTGETDTYTVTATWSHEDPIITTVTLDGETIETTPEHPFYVLLRGWVPAADLREGDQARQADDSYGVVEVVTQEQRPQVMYNITVAEAHTYFVGDEQWLVHNACNPWNEFQASRKGKFRDYAEFGFSNSRQEAASARRAYKDAYNSTDFPVIGSQTDTHVAMDWPDHQILFIPTKPGWSLDVNDAWVDGGIDRGATFYLASPQTYDTLWDKVNNRPTVFSQELDLLRDAGYIQVGDYKIPPSRP